MCTQTATFMRDLFCYRQRKQEKQKAAYLKTPDGLLPSSRAIEQFKWLLFAALFCLIDFQLFEGEKNRCLLDDPILRI